MCGTLDSLSDGLTGLSKSVGLKDLGDSVTEGLGIRGVGDLLADFDDALYDIGVRWDSVGQIAAVSAAVYTGGVMAGAWGQGGWLANTLGVTSTAGSTMTGAAAAEAAGAASQGSMLAAQTAAFGAEGAAMTGQALASATGGAASLANAGVMASYGGNALAAGELGAAYGGLTNAGAQGLGMASTGYAPIGSAAESAISNPSLFGGSSATYDAAGNLVSTQTGGLLGGTKTVAGQAAAAGSGGWFSNPLVQATALQMGGNMVSGMAQAQAAEEKYQRELEEAERIRKLKSNWASLGQARQTALARRGIIAGNMG